MTNEENKQRWQEIYERYVVSGLSVVKFCSGEGISKSTFIYWKDIFRGHKKREKAKSSFIPVNLSERSKLKVESVLPNPRWVAELILELSALGGVR